MTTTEKVSLAVTVVAAIAAIVFAVKEVRACDPALVKETRGDRVYLSTECKAPR